MIKKVLRYMKQKRVQYTYADKYSTKDECSLVYKGRNPVPYDGVCAPSYFPYNVDIFARGVDGGNH